MSLAELGRGLLEATPDQIAALLGALDEEEAAVVEAAWQQADLEDWRAGREADELRAAAATWAGCEWYRNLFPRHATSPCSDVQNDLWEWVEDIRRGERPRPRVDIWFRGGAKSSTAEAATVRLGSMGRRRYGLYVSATQDMANKHVQSIGDMLESPRFGLVYPEMADRAVGKFGAARGWSRNRLTTASGFTLDAIGLGVGARGIKDEEARPDLIIIDDIDDREDGPAAVEKKLELLTKTILPAGSRDVAVLAIQNVIHPNSIFARLAGLADQPADFLMDRITVGPIPAVEGLTVDTDDDGRHIILDGTPTWPAGYGLDAAQGSIDLFGFSSFLQECQHEVKARPGGMFDQVRFAQCAPSAVPFLTFRTCWVDPAIEGDDGSDCQGIQIDGMGENEVIYRLWSWEGHVGPLGALTRAIRMAMHYGSPTVGVETNQGGKTWESVYREACDVVGKGDDSLPPLPGPYPRFRSEKADRSTGGKAHRAGPMLTDYEVGGRIVHVLGTHDVLEASLFRFPRTKPLDLADAAVWSWIDCDKRRVRKLRIGSGHNLTVEKPPIVRAGPVTPTATRGGGVAAAARGGRGAVTLPGPPLPRPPSRIGRLTR